MQKIYVVTDFQHDEPRVVGLFDSWDKARAVANNYAAIDEFELNENVGKTFLRTAIVFLNLETGEFTSESAGHEDYKSLMTPGVAEVEWLSRFGRDADKAPHVVVTSPLSLDHAKGCALELRYNWLQERARAQV